MAPGTATETGKATCVACCHYRNATDKYVCRPAGRHLFPCNILVLGNRHRRNLATVHPDGPGTSAALPRLCEGETVLDAAQVRLLQHRLSSLLCPMVVLALVLLVVIVQLSSRDNAPSIACLTNSYSCIILSRSRAVIPVSL